MFKLLIVDDDLLARMGMQKLIDWGAYGYQVIGCADSGEQALELMKKELPDVVFTDVVMHGMDGVELTRRIKEQFPQVLVVALSCYTDVDYVKSIIRMGAEDYLQKLSMSTEDVIALLKELAVKLAARKAQADTHLRRELSRALLALIRSEESEKSCALLNELFLQGKTFRMLTMRRALGRRDYPQEMERARELFEKRGICCAQYREDLLTALVPDAPKEELKELAEELIGIEGALNSCPAQKRGCYVGFSDTFEQVQDIREHFFQAGEASLLCWLNKEQRVFFYRHADKEQHKQIYEQWERLNQMLDEADLAGAAQESQAMLLNMKAFEAQPDLCRQIYISLFSRMEHVLVSRNVEGALPNVAPNTIATVEEAHQTFINQIAIMNQRLLHAPGRYRREVRLAIAYIREHYSENITLSQVATRVSMSESRLSSVFKKETGKGLMRYLEEYRIAQAVRLMSERHVPLYIVAQEVGYTNVNYFSRVFKKVRTETPSQFLKRQKK